MKTGKLNYNKYNIIILILFTSGIILYVNYDLKFLNMMEAFEQEISWEEAEREEQVDPESKSYLLNKRKNELMMFLNRFKVLDVPINVDDNGIECNQWTNDPKGRYADKKNFCQLIGEEAYCLNNKNRMNTCNKLYTDEIKRMGKVDVNGITVPVFNKLNIEFRKIDKDINKKQIELDDNLNRLVRKKNLIEQQKFFMDQNSNQLSENKINQEEINEKYNEFNNKFHVSEVVATELQDDIKEQDEQNSRLMKVIYFLSVIIILMVVFSLLLMRV